ncbi:MAG: carboxylesterase [Rubellimicrobium sp.]|nr:carboxylesterase [Rubellimicrobium sp.]
MGLTAPLRALLAPAVPATIDEILRLREAMLAEGGVTLTERPRAGYDRLVDALNRLPRPLMALGSLVMLSAAMIAPDWFAGRMEGLAAVPEPLWWLIGAVISLFFGSRIQTHAQDFRREMTECVLAACEGHAGADDLPPTGAGGAAAQDDAVPSKAPEHRGSQATAPAVAAPTRT